MDPNTKTYNFFSFFKKQKFRKKEILIRADEDPAGVYYIKEGLVKSYIILNKGDEIVLNIFRPHSFIPMGWVINNEPNKYYYEAMTPVEVWRAPKEEVIKFIKKNPDILYDLLSRVFRGVEGIMLRLAHLRTGNAYARLISEILINTHRFGEKNQNADTVTLKIREKDLARQAGMTRETVSREMKQLKDKGFVSFEKNMLTVKNINALQEELENNF